MAGRTRLRDVRLDAHKARRLGRLAGDRILYRTALSVGTAGRAAWNGEASVRVELRGPDVIRRWFHASQLGFDHAGWPSFGDVRFVCRLQPRLPGRPTRKFLRKTVLRRVWPLVVWLHRATPLRHAEGIQNVRQGDNPDRLGHVSRGRRREETFSPAVPIRSSATLRCA